MRTSIPGNSEDRPSLAARARSPATGFTLIELLVVMVLMVLFIGMIIPSLASFYAESCLRSGLRRLLAQCQYARDQAVSRNLAVRVNWDVEEGTHYITVERPAEETFSASGGFWGGSGVYFPPSANMGLTDPEFVPEQTDLGGVQALPRGVAYAGILTRESDPEKITYVTFTPDGRAEDLAILLENARGTRRALVIDGLTGRCRVVGVEDLQAAGFRVD